MHASRGTMSCRRVRRPIYGEAPPTCPYSAMPGGPCWTPSHRAPPCWRSILVCMVGLTPVHITYYPALRWGRAHSPWTLTAPPRWAPHRCRGRGRLSAHVPPPPRSRNSGAPACGRGAPGSHGQPPDCQIWQSGGPPASGRGCGGGAANSPLARPLLAARATRA